MSVNPLSAALLVVLLCLLVVLFLRRRGFIVVAIVVTGVLWLAATPTVSHALKTLIESSSGELPAEALPKADAIVVLGGILSPPASADGTANLSAAADRLVFAAKLYELGKAPIILISGGHGSGAEAGTMDAESVHAAALLAAWGIPASAILTETESVNTYENAVYSKLMLDQHKLKKVLLVTSALHMPRALATFKSAGIDATPAATDFESAAPGPSGLEAWIASPAALEGTSRVLKEYVGWIVYRQRGWISG